MAWANDDHIDWSDYEVDSDSDSPYYSEDDYSDSEFDEDSDDPNNNQRRRRRKTEEKPAVDGPVFPMGDLPNDVLLIIFSFLPFKDKCRLTRVNKRWKMLLAQRSLWTRVIIPEMDLGCYAKPDFRNKLVKIMKARFGPSLVYLQISIMSAAGLRFLDQKCSNLLSLVLEVENSSLNLGTLPSTLTFLELQFNRGNSRQDWWSHITSSNLPALKSLAINGGSAFIRLPRELRYGYDSLYAFQVFLRQLAEFKELKHLELSVGNWDLAREEELINRLGDFLDPLAQTLDSFCVTSSGPYFWVPDTLAEYIGEEMKMLKHLKVSLNEHDDPSIHMLSCLTTLPQLETLYLPENISLNRLKAVLPLFPKLKELHLYNVDRKLQIWEWREDDKGKYRPMKNNNSQSWKSVVEALTSVCPGVKYHVMQHKLTPRMKSASC